jgi:predicted O-linked N-acetylglucosamine transferase (SPINDLY family)
MLQRLIRSLFDGRRARRIDGLLERGLKAQQQNDMPAAIGHYRAAMAVAPGNPDILCLLGNALQAAGHADEAREMLRAAVAAAPASRDAWFLLAGALPLPACRDEVIHALRRTLTLGGDNAQFRLNYRLAQLLRDGNEYDAAISHFAAALEVHGDTRELDVNAQLANVLHARGRVDEARRHYAQAWEMNRADVMRLKRVTILPPVPQSAAHIVQVRAQLAQEVEALLAQDLRLGQPENDIGHTDFYLAYHGLDDRPLKELLARMYLHAYPSLRFVSPHLAEVVARRTGKLRIGIVSSYLRTHTIGRLMLDVFRHLRRDMFDVTAFVFSPAEDEIAREIHQLSDKVVILDRVLDDARQRVAGEKPDLLLYCDIGMEPFTYFMAFARLAPVQCVTWGHPVTTGLPEMDYFVSSALAEPADAAAHYSEKLECLPESCAFACYSRPAIPEPPADRAQFGFAADAHVYLCPQTLFKLHPDFDALIGGILRGDPAALLVVIDHPPHLHAQLVARWARTLGDVVPRIRFAPFYSHGEFLRLLDLADVILDPPHFGGGNSSLEAMAVGTPVVTLPGAFARSRFTLANYRRMGVLDCVASSAQEYVDIAVRLGTDPAYRSLVKARIVGASHRLYDDVGAVRELERFFVEAVGRARNLQE